MNTTQLTVADRAAVAIASSKAEAELIALAATSKAIVNITNSDGRAECHAAAMAAKAARIEVEKAGKAARDDSTAFSKAVIAEEKRLVDLIKPEEMRLIHLRDEWDSKIAREKAEKAEAERLALAAIMQRIAKIKNFPLLLENSSSEAVLDDIQKLEAIEIDDSFKTFYGEAVEAKAKTLQTMREIYAAKCRAEAEALRIKAEQAEQFKRIQAEREELAKLRAEKELREAEEKKARDAEIARLQRIRDEIAATQLLLAAEKSEAEKREANRIAAEKQKEQPQVEQKEQPQVEQPAPAAVEQKPIALIPATASADTPDYADRIRELISGMDNNELKIVAHCCERIVSQRIRVA